MFGDEKRGQGGGVLKTLLGASRAKFLVIYPTQRSLPQLGEVGAFRARQGEVHFLHLDGGRGWRGKKEKRCCLVARKSAKCCKND